MHRETEGREPERPIAAPSVLGRGLGAELRRLREAAGLAAQAAGAACGISETALRQLEAGHLTVPRPTLVELLDCYGVSDDDRRAELLALADRAAGPGWWQAYADILPPVLETYLRLEQASYRIRSYAPDAVPRLLQTRDYAAATIGSTFEKFGTTHLGITRDADVDRQVELRMMRQRVLDTPDGPTVWALVDEAALWSPVGDRNVVAAQLTHLLEVVERPKVVVQVIPDRRRHAAAASNPFILMRFAQRHLTDVAYVEQTTRPLYLDRRADVDHHTILMDRLLARAEHPAATPSILRRIRAEL